MTDQIGFIGFGLIGGSLAKSIKKYGLTKQIIAYDSHHDSLEVAKKDGTIDIIATSINDGFDQCDLIFLCCPVNVNIQLFKELTSIVKADCIITDVGSTKGDIHKSINALNLKTKFIGGHPMTGSEKSGYSASSIQLFENIYYILTPSDHSNAADLEVLTTLISAIDSIPIIMTVEEHDQVTASISHVPHILAILIVNAVKELDTDKHYMHTLAAGGFKDITRIASGSPIMWQQICLSNKAPILFALKHYKTMLDTIETIIESGDVEQLKLQFENAKDYRATFNDSKSGLLPRTHSFGIDINDELGIIAKIATLLSEAHINIKNIGIVNNREVDKGVLRIQFDDQTNMNQSITLLTNLGYTLYT